MMDLMVLNSCKHNNQSIKKLDFSFKNTPDDHDETKLMMTFLTPKRPSPLNIAPPHFFDIILVGCCVGVAQKSLQWP